MLRSTNKHCKTSPSSFSNKPPLGLPPLRARPGRKDPTRGNPKTLKAPPARRAPAVPPDSKILVSALGHMSSAKTSLDQVDGKAADSEEQKALKDLYALQDQV